MSDDRNKRANRRKVKLMKKRNPIAADLGSGKYRQRVIRDKRYAEFDDYVEDALVEYWTNKNNNNEQATTNEMDSRDPGSEGKGNPGVRDKIIDSKR